MPRFYVTSLLYVPEGLKDPVPGIIFLCGHAKEAKAYPLYQRVCIDLVKNGFVVLAIDPIGQGERLQYWSASTKSEIIRWGTYEHSYVGLQCTLLGCNVARYFIYDAMRGIDYLLTRKEVDEKRIGATGSSGGGTQTAYLMLIDDRLKAAAPCNYITSRDAYIKTGQAHDAEQNIYGAIKVGLNYDDFILAFAPKPVLIGASAYDFFCIEGTIQSYERAKRIYRLFNAEDKIALYIGKHTHYYSPELRQAVVNWFKVHLKDEEPDFITKDEEVEDVRTLSVTESGQVLEDYNDALTVYDLNLMYWKKIKPERKTITDNDLEGYIRETRLKLSDLLNLRREKSTIYPRIISKIEWSEYTIEKIFFPSEPDIMLTALMFYKEESSSPAMVFILESGTENISVEFDNIKSYLEKGYKVFVLDVRGVGAVKVRRINPADLYEIYGTEFRLAYDALMLGTSTMAMRVYDVIRGFDYLSTRNDITRIGIYGKGRGALYAFFASVMDDRPEVLVFEDMLFSFEDVIKTRVYNRKTCDERIVVHGMLKHFDIIDLVPLLHGRDYNFINLRNAKGDIVSEGELNNYWIDTANRYYPFLDISKRVELRV